MRVDRISEGATYDVGAAATFVRFMGWSALSIACGAGIAWWLIGNVGSEPGFGVSSPMWTPPAVMSEKPWLFGLTGVTLLGGFVSLRIAGRLQTDSSRTTRILSALLLCGLVVGCFGRVIGAAGIDSNIGGGIALIFGLPLVAVTIVSLLWFGRGCRVDLQVR